MNERDGKGEKDDLEIEEMRIEEEGLGREGKRIEGGRREMRIDGKGRGDRLGEEEEDRLRRTEDRRV